MIDCKKYADEILNGIKARVEAGESRGHLVVISVGDDPASESYVKGKKKDCEKVGFEFSRYKFPADAETKQIVQLINQLRTYDLYSCQSDITGLIVQLPVPEQIDMNQIMAVIPRRWDVDGFLPKSPFRPCTPEGIIHVMKKEIGDLTGLHAVVVGRGKLVGKPLAQMLLDEDMTVTVCHSKTRNIVRQVGEADVIISAIGKPNYFDAQKFCLVWDGTPVIDCGVNRDENGKLCGDVVANLRERQTPVPGGVGLMTRAMLMRHVERKATKCLERKATP